MKKLMTALAVVFFFAATAEAITTQQYERLLRDTCLMGKSGVDKESNNVSWLEIDRGMQAAVFMMYPELNRAEIRVINFMGKDDSEYKTGALVDKDLDGVPDYYQTMHFKDGIGEVTSEGTDTSNLLDLWYYWLGEFVRLTGGQRW